MGAIWTDYVVSSIIFNLRILPETLMSGILILAILLANQPLLAIAAGAGATQLLTHAIGRLIMNNAPDGAVLLTSLDVCTTGYGGAMLELLTGDPERMWHPYAPSIFMSTIGFFAGWGASLQQLYKEEINAGVMSKSLLIAMTTLTAILVILTLAFRVFSGCETLMGGLAGLTIGIIFGFLGCIALGYASNRRATNVWGIPLLRDRISDGSPVYVCPGK